MSADTIAIIQHIEQRLRMATLHNDVALHQELLADTWRNTNANGTITTKPQLLQLLQSHPFAFVAIEDTDVHIQTYAQCAIVTGLSTRSRTGQDGNTMTQRVRFTRVYACLQERWQVVAAQATPTTIDER
jgi:hypothetical protein